MPHQDKISLGPKPLLFPLPVLVVGTYDENNKPNVMVASWGGVCCSKPPAINVSLRKATYTYSAIVAKKVFTVNIPSVKYVAEADYFGSVSGRDIDKFAVTGLTPEPAEFIDAPYVKEFPIILECQLIHTLEIGLHTLFVGEVIDVKADPKVMGEVGNPKIEGIRPLAWSVSDREYYSLGKPIGKTWEIGKKFEKKV